MRNPYESTNDGETECNGCGEPADGEVMVVGRAYPVPLCRDCQDGLLTVCPSCERTIWQAEGKRTFHTPSLYCKHCDAIVQAAVNKTEIPEFDQVRR